MLVTLAPLLSRLEQFNTMMDSHPPLPFDVNAKQVLENCGSILEDASRSMLHAHRLKKLFDTLSNPTLIQTPEFDDAVILLERLCLLCASTGFVLVSNLKVSGVKIK